MSTTFPTTLDTAATLYETVNNAESTLAAGYTAGGVTLDLASAALFPSTGGVIYVGNERTTYTGKSSNQLTGVTALLNNYSNGTTVAMYNDADHHNALRDAIVAVETIVGATGSVVAGTVTKRLTDLEASSSTVAAQIHAASAKTVPEDTDEMGIADNAGAWALKKTTWAQIKTALWTAWGALINSGTSKTTPVDGDAMSLMDSAASNATKKLTWANLKATLKTYFDGLYVGASLPQNSKSAAYTTVLSDANKHIFHPSADTTARTFTIDSNANVAYDIGTAITFVNQNGAGVVTIAITTDTMRLAGAGTTGSRTLAANGIATALKIATTEWIISGPGLT